jgi:hypothetical protein
VRCGLSSVGSDFGPVPYGIKEQVQIVDDVLSNSAERELVFWNTSNRIFRLNLSDTGEQSIAAKSPAKRAA